MNTELYRERPTTADSATIVRELSRNRRIAVLFITCLSLFIAGLDVTIVNVALPSLALSLHSSLSGLQWTVDAYTVVMASLLMLCGSLGDRLGRKRMFIAGLAVFSVGSLLSSLAPTVGILVASRILQAVGGAMLNPVAVSIITNTFTDPRERAQAVGVRGSVYRRIPGPWPDRGRSPGVLDRVAVDLPGQRSPRASSRSSWQLSTFPSPGRRGRGDSIRSVRCWSRSCSRRSPMASSRARAKDGPRPPSSAVSSRPARRSSACSSTSPADSNP